MNKVLILFDRFNNRWLQNAEEPYNLQWTDCEGQCSFYQEEDLPELLDKIKATADGEVWIEVKTIYVNL